MTSSAPQPTGLPDSHPLLDGRTASSPLVRAYRGERTSHRPIWMMRQAGRSLPEYRAVREGTAMLDSCPVSYTHLDVYKRQLLSTTSANLVAPSADSSP